MAEEFITDIIKGSEESKTEAEMVADIQGDDVDKAAEIQKDVTEKATTSALKTINATKDNAEDVKSNNGGEADPDLVQHDNKAADADSATIEELAAQIGWRKDHTGDDAVDAKTYILKSKDIQKSMGQHNKDLKSQLQGLSGSIESLKQHNESVYKSEVKRLTGEVASLKKERRAAIELADVSKVDELDKQIDDIQKDIDTPKPEDKKTQDIDNPAYDDWVKDNDWYLKDDEMAKYADTVAEQYAGAPLDRVYKLVRSKVQEVFPDKFDTVKVAENKVADVVKPIIGPKSPVESSSAKGSEGSFTKADLTQDQLQIMRQFVGGGIMTEEQYVNDIAKMQ